jgi:hypothetical protein
VDRLREVALLRIEVGIEQDLRHAEDPVHRRADLVAHGGEELGLGAARRLGSVERGFQFSRLAPQLHGLRGGMATGSFDLLELELEGGFRSFRSVMSRITALNSARPLIVMGLMTSSIGTARPSRVWPVASKVERMSGGPSGSARSAT